MVEVQLSYNLSYVHFHASYEVQSPGMFANALTNAIKRNLQVLEACKHCSSINLKYSIALDDEELS